MHTSTLDRTSSVPGKRRSLDHDGETVGQTGPFRRRSCHAEFCRWCPSHDTGCPQDGATVYVPCSVLPLSVPEVYLCLLPCLSDCIQYSTHCTARRAARPASALMRHPLGKSSSVCRQIDIPSQRVLPCTLQRMTGGTDRCVQDGSRRLACTVRLGSRLIMHFFLACILVPFTHRTRTFPLQAARERLTSVSWPRTSIPQR